MAELSSREKIQRDQQDSIKIPTNEDVEKSTVSSPFNKTLTTWNESTLANMIRDRVEENLGIEYKAAAALQRESRKTAEITKDVSSMANSAGGILIYGIAQFQDPEKKHLPERIDPIVRTEFSKEWLEQIISQIRPRIPDLQILSVQLASSPDHVAYVVEIPQGSTAHQATDCRYYRRYNFEALPMQDHEVRDVMNRKSHPRVAVSARFVVYPHQNRDGAAGALVVNLTNKSDVLARYVALVIHSPFKIRGQFIFYTDATLDDREYGQALVLSFSNHNSAPLFPRGTLEKMFPFKYATPLRPASEKQLDHFRWVVFADSMPMQRGICTVDEIFEKMS